MGPLQQLLPTGDRTFLERQGSSFAVLLVTVLALGGVFAVVGLWGATSTTLSALVVALLAGAVLACALSPVDTVLFTLFVVLPLSLFAVFVLVPYDSRRWVLAVAAICIVLALAATR